MTRADGLRVREVPQVRLVASVAWPLATVVAKRTQRLHGGVGLSHERLDIAGAESLYSLEGNMCGMLREVLTP